MIKSWLYIQQLQAEDPVVEECKGKSVFEAIIESKNYILIVAEIEDTIVSSCYLNIIPNLTRNTKIICGNRKMSLQK